MKKYRLIHFSLFMFLFLFSACKSNISEVRENPDIKTEEKETFPASKISELTLEEKRGLLTMISISDKVLSERTINFLIENKISGIVLFSHNIVNEIQLKKLTDDLRARTGRNLLIAIDQEGGLVTRIGWDKYAGISARQIGLKNDYNYAYKIGYERAKFLLDLGINVILGPVCDVAPSKNSYIYERSFGTDPDIVSKMVEATVKGQKDAGIITVLKHFPGHGKTSIDSHREFPVIDLDLEYLKMNDFKPFINGIEAGAEMVMLGHIINNNIDSEKPASLSLNYIKLLDNINFSGIVITDDLSMTGQINRGIGWGINLVSGGFDYIKSKVSTIEPVDYYCLKILEIKQNNGAYNGF